MKDVVNIDDLVLMHSVEFITRERERERERERMDLANVDCQL